MLHLAFIKKVEKKEQKEKKIKKIKIIDERIKKIEKFQKNESDEKIQVLRKSDVYQAFPLYAPPATPPIGSEPLSDFLQHQVDLTLLQRTRIMLEIALQLQRWHECTLKNGRSLAHGEVNLGNCSVLLHSKEIKNKDDSNDTHNFSPKSSQPLFCNFSINLELSDLLLDRMLSSERISIFDLKNDIKQLADLCRIIYGNTWQSMPFLAVFLQRMEACQLDSQPNAAEVVRFFTSLSQWYYLKSQFNRKMVVALALRHYALLALLEENLWHPTIDCLPDETNYFIAIAYLKRRQLLNSSLINSLLKCDGVSRMIVQALVELEAINLLTAKTVGRLSDSDWVVSQWVCTVTGLKESRYLTHFLVNGIQQEQFIAKAIMYFFLLIYGQCYLEQQAAHRLIRTLKRLERPAKNKSNRALTDPREKKAMTQIQSQYQRRSVKTEIYLSRHQNGFFFDSFERSSAQEIKSQIDPVQLSSSKKTLLV